MTRNNFTTTLRKLEHEHEALITRKNVPEPKYNGIYARYRYPVITASHAPLHWRFDLNPETNPLLLERIGVNATLNSGAIEFDGKYA